MSGGFGLGLARFPKRFRWWFVVFPVWLATSMAIHSLWNYWLGLADATSENATFQRVVSVSLMAFTTLMFGASVYVSARWSKAIIAPWSKKRIWGWPFSLLLRGGDDK